jgi:plasmid stability protein
MPVDFSIKHVPDDVARRLRKRADQHHRSLQGELLAILHEAVANEAVVARESAAPVYRATARTRVAPASESALMIRQTREGRTVSVADLHAFAAERGLSTPDEATGWIRKERSRR